MNNIAFGLGRRGIGVLQCWLRYGRGCFAELSNFALLLQPLLPRLLQKRLRLRIDIPRKVRLKKLGGGKRHTPVRHCFF